MFIINIQITMKSTWVLMMPGYMWSLYPVDRDLPCKFGWQEYPEKNASIRRDGPLTQETKRIAGKTLTILIQSLFLGSHVWRSVPKVMHTQFLWRCSGSQTVLSLLDIDCMLIANCNLVSMTGAGQGQVGWFCLWLFFHWLLQVCRLVSVLLLLSCWRWTHSQCSDPSDFVALAAFISLLAVGQRLPSLPCWPSVSAVAHSMEACFFKASRESLIAWWTLSS